MKRIQCAHPPHHHNGFVATCRLWTASGGVHALLVLEPTEVKEIRQFGQLIEYNKTNIILQKSYKK